MDDRRPGDHDTANTQVDALAQTAFVVMAVLTRVAAANDLSLTQLRVFGILRDRRPRMAELASYLGLERSTMSGLIGRAEKRGIVRREDDPVDGRGTAVIMTPQGIELARVIHAEIRRELMPLLGRLDPGEGDRLAALLTRMLGTENGPGEGAT